MKTNFNEIAKLFHERAKAKGFWDEKRENGSVENVQDMDCQFL